MFRPSLKTKTTLLLPIATCVSIALILLLVHTYFQRTLKESISLQQHLTATVLADEIDQKLLSTQDMLIEVARKVTPEMAGDPKKVVDFLREKTEYARIFDNGMFLFDSAGHMVGELPLGTSRTGSDFSYRDYLKATFAKTAPVISEPYISSQSHHHPSIMFTAPVLDGNGKLFAILGGSVDLTRSNFLGKIMSVKIGRTGYMFLFSENRTMILHPDPSRVMKADIPPGANRLIDKALKDFDGTDETINSRGIRMLTSMRHLRSKPWILGANFPVSEAYRQIYRLNLIFAVGFVPFILLIFFIMRHYMRKMTEPLLRFTRHVEQLASKTGKERLYQQAELEEVATLGNAFNKLITSLDSHQEELAKREILYRTIVEFSSDLIFWISPDRKTLYYISPGCDRITGYREKEFYEDPDLLNRMIHPDYQELWQEHVRHAINCDCSEPLELSVVTKNGTTSWVSHDCRSVFNDHGDFCGFRGNFNDLSLLKESENARLESEEKFRTLFDHAGDAIFIIDIEGRIIEVNQEAVRRLGYTRNELLSMRATDIETPECAAKLPDRFADLRRNGIAFFECVQRCKDNSSIQVEINACLCELGGKQAIVAVSRDITDRRKSHDLLHRQNEYLMALHKTTLGLISRLEINSLLMDIITRAATLMNTEHGYIYLLNAEATEMVIQVQLGVFERFKHHPLRRGEGMAGFVWKHGHPYCVDDYRAWTGRLADPMRDVLHAIAGIPLTSGGEVIGVIGLAYIDDNNRFDDDKMGLLSRFAELASLALDNARLYDAVQKELNERTKAEESLRKLSHVVEQSPVSIIITDLQGNIEYANPYSTKLTGYDLDEMLGKNPRILKSGFTTTEEYRILWETILAGGEWSGELHNRKKNGDYYWELALISPIRDNNGKTTHYIAIKEDITERKKLENQLRHSQKMEAVGQLAGGIAHDFNNILTAIIGYATIMQMQITEESRLKTTVEQILATAERGASLTQGLLAFSRKQVSNPSRINLNEIIERVNRLLLRLIGEDIHLKAVLADEELPVMADSIQIEQVIMNLSTNARDSMPDGGTIVIKTEVVTLDSNFVSSQGFGEPGRYALITVSDTGCGMDEETVKRIFEPFYTTKETGKGTGLGLSIVYGITKKCGGYITCDSSPGKGTGFRVYLPLIEHEEQSVPPETCEVQFRRGSELILLAEDDETTRELTKELLEEFGYSVIEAMDGFQAIERYREQRDLIRMVILDAIMPGMKGMDVYREIRELTPDARVLFCSGYNLETIEGQGALDRNLHFISKPFMPKELLMKIREVLDDDA